MVQKAKKNYYNNLNVRNITDNKQFENFKSFLYQTKLAVMKK